MSKITFAIKALVFGLVLVATGSMAQAQTRTWVAGTGSDANPCSYTAPCKTFAAAHAVTVSGGEINAINSGAYGTILITKSMTVDGGGNFSSILASGTTGVTVNIAGGHVVLRNLDIFGAGTGVDGIRVLQAASVRVENCNIVGFTGQGIDWSPSSADGILTVKNVSTDNCVGGGVSVVNTSGLGRASIEKSSFHRGAYGVRAGGNGIVSVTDSTANGTTDGFLADAGSAQLNLDRCVSTNNTNGVKVDNGAAARISNCQISTNTSYGLRIVFGIIETYESNMVRGNPSNDVATIVSKT